MDVNKRTLYCPHHGALLGLIEYISVDIGRKRIVDVPLCFCKSCKTYFTSYTNLFALVDPSRLIYKGFPIAPGKGRVEKDRAKKAAPFPHIVDIEEDNRQKEQARQEELKKKLKEQKLIEKRRKYAESLRGLPDNSLIVTNKPCFVLERACPHCRQKTRKEHVRIIGDRGYLLSNVYRCTDCNSDYVTPGQFLRIREKAAIKESRNYFINFNIVPQNVSQEYVGDECLFILNCAFDEKYSRRHLPPRSDEYYDMTENEYEWVKRLYASDFPVQLRQKSFLSEAGYSTNESEYRRRKALARCVDEYGKSKVINQLKINMNLRLKQENGSVRYANALAVWRGDIWYVEHELHSD